MKEYLIETPSIDYMNPIIQEKIQELRNKSSDDLNYIENPRKSLSIRLENLATKSC